LEAQADIKQMSAFEGCALYCVARKGQQKKMLDFRAITEPYEALVREVLNAEQEAVLKGRIH
jgi:hypothetical protein